MTYTELVALIKQYLHRDDLDDNVAGFITLAQARMNHDLTTPLLDVSTTVSVTAADSSVALPTDCLKVLSLRIPYSSGYRELQQQTLAGTGARLESDQGSTSTPKYYSLYGLNIELSPTPTSSATAVLVYRQKLDATSGTDPILTHYPNLYVYATMLEAQPFVINDKRIKTFGAMYENEVTRVNEAGDKLRWSDSPKQVKFLGHSTP